MESTKSTYRSPRIWNNIRCHQCTRKMIKHLICTASTSIRFKRLCKQKSNRTPSVVTNLLTCRTSSTLDRLPQGLDLLDHQEQIPQVNTRVWGCAAHIEDALRDARTPHGRIGSEGGPGEATRTLLHLERVAGLHGTNRARVPPQQGHTAGAAACKDPCWGRRLSSSWSDREDWKRPTGPRGGDGFEAYKGGSVTGYMYSCWIITAREQRGEKKNPGKLRAETREGFFFF